MESSSPQSEQVLSSQPGHSVIRMGDQILRRTAWWTPAVHSLLNYLESIGFEYSPRVRGIDQQGREILSYIDGESGKDSWAHIVSDAGLAEFAKILRKYHDAAAGFRPPPETIWHTGQRLLKTGEIICHGDFGPWNIIWRDERPIGIIDWDCADPGLAIDDIAYALEYSAPFRDDDTCIRWLRYEQVPDRKHRIAVFALAYGLQSTEGLVDHVIRIQRRGIDIVRALADRGMEPQVTWVANGYLDELAARVAWSEQNQGLFE